MLRALFAVVLFINVKRKGRVPVLRFSIVFHLPAYGHYNFALQSQNANFH